MRKVKLINYLPPYLREFKELDEILNTEDIEFNILWNSSKKIILNVFIETADDYGLSQFEKLLGIFPFKDDTLEIRRQRVQIQWFNMLPYTYRAFIKKLIEICADDDFTVEKDFMHYSLKVTTNLKNFRKLENLKYIFYYMLPCNLLVSSYNNINISINSNLFMGGGMCAVETFILTNDFNTGFTINGDTEVKSGMVSEEFFQISI